MAELIHASDLAVGDVYRNVRGLAQEPSGDAYRVAAIRQVTYLETYSVIEASNLRTGLRAEINLRRDVFVSKLEEQARRDVVGLLDYLPDGETVTIVRSEGRFWA
ncbi:hypothetical protein I5G62_gp83 [Mycobacterium phage CRB2]|uniref:Uncharacterized protein n=1 Tax=Mycobacterium phage CRB2 TaxID=2483623 RepID=A0A455M3W7_9CAUD|nr:hypothetical protein I5G62_gp83 [Mycobacterium phage CRB2]AYP70069.1 hypothetical protein CRB2_83 [Mycobacterium phage CRB2]